MSSAVELRVGQRLLDRPAGPLDEVLGQLLELGPGQRCVQVLWACRVGGHKWQVDLRRRGRGQLHLRPLRCLVEALESLRVIAEVDALIALELLGKPIHDALVEVVAAEVAVAVGSPHLDHAVANVEQRHVEGAAAEIEDQDCLGALFVEAVCERGSGRLVDDPQDLEAGDLARVLGSLALGVVEVRGHGDDRLGHPFPEELAGVLGELAEHERGDLFRRVLLASQFEADRVAGALHDPVRDDLGLLVHLAPLAADEPLGGVDRGLGVEDRLALCNLTHQTLAVLREGDHRWRHPPALGVRDHLGLSPLHRCGYHRVRGS